MTQAAYSPMHSLRKEVSQEDMWEKLKRHLPPDSPLQMQAPEAQSPKEKHAIAPLQWLKPVKTGANAGYVLTQCGRYSISKDSVHGKALYMAWATRDPPHASINLGVRPTRAEAEALCESAQ